MDGIFGVIIAAIVGYLLGSIPFGLLLTKAAGMGDIRAMGSGNIGATNVLRTGNKWLALATLLLDAGKGALAVIAAREIAPDATLIAAAAAFFGHLYPMWLNFRGGKGVAVFLGIALAINPGLGAVCCGVWLLTGLLFRYSSMAALAAAAIAPIYAMAILRPFEIAVLFLLLALMIFQRHSSNIRRLLRGEEPKIGQK
ncbi:MAG: glycerol-3-phosphate 1-O-acyltransferase PlsY [Sphingomonadales bacterium]